MDKKRSQMSAVLLLVLVFAFRVVAAVEGSDQIRCAMYDLCVMFETLLPIFAFVLFILAGVAYAVGNFFGAETRAKAIGYAMNMLTGAIIALLLGIIGPTILGALMPTTSSIDVTGGCVGFGTGCT